MPQAARLVGNGDECGCLDIPLVFSLGHTIPISSFATSSKGELRTCPALVYSLSPVRNDVGRGGLDAIQHSPRGLENLSLGDRRGGLSPVGGAARSAVSSYGAYDARFAGVVGFPWPAHTLYRPTSIPPRAGDLAGDCLVWAIISLLISWALRRTATCANPTVRAVACTSGTYQLPAGLVRRFAGNEPST